MDFRSKREKLEALARDPGATEAERVLARQKAKALPLPQHSRSVEQELGWLADMMRQAGQQTQQQMAPMAPQQQSPLFDALLRGLFGV